MDTIFSRILFFILGVFYAPTALFLHLTYPWWQAQHKGGPLRKILFFVLGIIYAPLAFFMHQTYTWWAELF